MKFDIVNAIVYLRVMIKVILLGSGNVATHLFQAFSKADEIEVVQVFSRTISKDLFISTKQQKKEKAIKLAQNKKEI